MLPDGPHPPGHSDAVWTGTEMVLVDRYSADQVAEPVAVSAFNPSTNEWRSLPPVPIEGPVEKVVDEGTDVVVLAGTDRGYRMAVMDTTTDSWTVLPDPPSVVLFPSIAVTDGYISYVGSKPLSENVQVGDLAFRVYVFDRSTDQWGEFVGPEQFGGNLRADQFLAEFVDGELIVVGETAVTGDPNGFSSGAVDPATGQWRIIDASELSACVQHEIMLVNRVLVRVACGVGDGLLLPGAGAWEVSSTEPFATPFWGGVAFGDALYQFSGCGDQGYCANSFKRLDLAALMP